MPARKAETIPLVSNNVLYVKSRGKKVTEDCIESIVGYTSELLQVSAGACCVDCIAVTHHHCEFQFWHPDV